MISPRWSRPGSAGSVPMPDGATGAHVDHYALLDVAPGATTEEIERTYH
jgi:hypothetical protein